MATADDLRRRLDALRDIRAGGARSSRQRSGDEEQEVVFATDRELAASIASLEAQLRAAEGRPAPSTIHFRTSKGLDR